MKNVLKAFLFAFVGLGLLTLASCGETHEHTALEGWKRDSAQHWHECECGEMVDTAIHNYGEWKLADGVCKQQKTCGTCGFVFSQTVDHTWSDWAEKDGKVQRSCTHCGETEGMTQYYLKGTFTNPQWAAGDHKLEIDVEEKIGFIVVDLAAGAEFKVGSQSGWEFNAGNVTLCEGLGGTDNIVCKTAGSYKVIYDYTTGKVKVTAADAVTLYYIKGSFTSPAWGDSPSNAANALVYNKETNKASITLELTVGAEFKVGTETGWEFNAGNVTLCEGLAGDDNIKCTVAGTYVVTFDYATKTVTITK